MAAYYSENDPFAAAWLRELIKDKLIADGEVDERSIADVSADDVRGFIQCHWFAGVAGWSYALRLAGWPDDRPVWTGSCPCQPFSAAGAQQGRSDPRHLWPEFFRLIDACRPPVIFGEQVASQSALGWLSRKGSDVQAVQDREAVFGVLRELERQSPRHLHALRVRAGTSEETGRTAQGHRAASRMASEESGRSAGECGSVSSASETTAVRPRRERYSTAHHEWLLRIDGDSLRSDIASLLECPVAGSDSAGTWLYAGQCAGGSLFPECDGERVGHRQDYADCVGDYESAQSAERRLAAGLDGAFEGQAFTGASSVFSDLERAGYAVGACGLPAASVGAFHIRQRLWFVADHHVPRCGPGRAGEARRRRDAPRQQLAGLCAAGDVADADGRHAIDGELQRRGEHGLRTESGCADGAARVGERGEGLADADRAGQRTGCGPIRDERNDTRRGGSVGDMGNTSRERLDQRDCLGRLQREALESHAGEAAQCSSRPPGFWSDVIWLPCSDGKARPTQSVSLEIFNALPPELGYLCDPGAGRAWLSPLMTGSPNRVGRLRGYGNSVHAGVAAAFIAAYMDIT